MHHAKLSFSTCARVLILPKRQAASNLRMNPVPYIRTLVPPAPWLGVTDIITVSGTYVNNSANEVKVCPFWDTDKLFEDGKLVGVVQTINFDDMYRALTCDESPNLHFKFSSSTKFSPRKKISVPPRTEPKAGVNSCKSNGLSNVYSTLWK